MNFPESGTRIFLKSTARWTGKRHRRDHCGQVLDSQQQRIRERTGNGALKACKEIQLMERGRERPNMVYATYREIYDSCWSCW